MFGFTGSIWIYAAHIMIQSCMWTLSYFIDHASSIPTSCAIQVANYGHHKTLYMHLYWYALHEQGTQSSIDLYLTCSAAIKFHNITSTPTYHTDHIPCIYIPYTHALQSFCIQARQTISAMLSIETTLYIAATHNITFSLWTSTCTTLPALLTTQPDLAKI